MGQLSQSKRKDIGHELEVACVIKRMKTMDYDDNKQNRISFNKVTKKSNKSTKLRSELKKLLPELEKKLLNEKKKKEKFKGFSLFALAEGRNEVISNEQKSIDELAQASKHGKDKVAKLDGKIMNGVGEMMRSQNKIIKIKK
nr:hypothetical protein [Tanacetum cinerariifolium]